MKSIISCKTCIFFGCQFAGRCSRSHSNILQHLPGKCPPKSHWKKLPPANCSPLPYQYDLRAHCTVHTVESLLTRHLAVAELKQWIFFLNAVDVSRRLSNYHHYCDGTIQSVLLKKQTSAFQLRSTENHDCLSSKCLANSGIAVID